MNKKTQLILVSIPLLIAVIGVIQIGAQSEIPDVTNLVTLEGVITDIRPDEYYSFKVAYYLEDELIESWCTPSTFFTTLYMDGEIITNENRVLALVDKYTGTGTVFDSVPAEPEPEPEPTPEPEPEPVPEPEEDEPIPEPEEEEPVEPEQEICLPDGLELVSNIAAPSPDITFCINCK